MKPSWFCLLEQYQKEGHFGLTIPFLIGALRTPAGVPRDADSARRELAALLDEIRDETPAQWCVRIHPCDTTQPIVALLKGPPADDCVPLTSSRRATPALFVYPAYVPEPQLGTSSVAAALWKLHQEALSESRFSYQEKDDTYHPFSTAEREFIDRALSSAADE